MLTYTVIRVRLHTNANVGWVDIRMPRTNQLKCNAEQALATTYEGGKHTVRIQIRVCMCSCFVRARAVFPKGVITRTDSGPPHTKYSAGDIESSGMST